jgi:prepilin-type N-terminal cleavage/methylation domain-containing protein
MHRLSSQKGFALIEILIVVAIIGILASITIPINQKYVARPKNSMAMSDLKNFKAGMETLYSDNQRYPALL